MGNSVGSLGDSVNAIIELPALLSDILKYGTIAVIGTLVFVGIAIGIGQIRNPATISLSGAVSGAF